jgi:NADH-ubiquinone oxidoreductase chain 6
MLRISSTKNIYIFIQIKHPLAIGIILLIQTIITCLIRGLINKRFWFQYILFIVFVGGMLVEGNERCQERQQSVLAVI